MVKPKGWDGVKPYWWCDTPFMRSVVDHIKRYLPQPQPYFGIYIKGTEKSKPESIEINRLHGSEILNINSNSSDLELLFHWVSNIRLIMDDAFIDNAYFTYNSEEHFNNKNTYNLKYKWQQLEKKSRHLEL